MMRWNKVLAWDLGVGELKSGASGRLRLTYRSMLK